MTRLLVLAATLLVASCSNIKTVHDRDPSADFGTYRTWAWVSDDSLIRPKAGEAKVTYVSPIDEQRIRRAVETELARRGYKQAPREQADLIVIFAVGSEDKMKIVSTPTMGGGYYDPYYGDFGYGGWYGGSDVRSVQYTEGTLSLQFFDRRTKQAVWVGWGSKKVSKSDDPDELIRDAVAAILKEFPAKS